MAVLVRSRVHFGESGREGWGSYLPEHEIRLRECGPFSTQTAGNRAPDTEGFLERVRRMLHLLGDAVITSRQQDAVPNFREIVKP